MPSRDNEARKPGRGSSYIGSSTAAYAAWLRSACEASVGRRPEESACLLYQRLE